MGGARYFCPNTSVYPRLGNTDIPDVIFFQMSFDGPTEGKKKKSTESALCASSDSRHLPGGFKDNH